MLLACLKARERANKGVFRRRHENPNPPRHFSHDFDGDGPRALAWNFERSPTCSGNNGSEYCKGNLHSTFGDAAISIK